MTPRSRKPVIFGALRDLATDNYHKNFVDFEMGDNENTDTGLNDHDTNDNRCNSDADPLSSSLERSTSESDSLPKMPSTPTITGEKVDPTEVSDESLSTPFR